MSYYMGSAGPYYLPGSRSSNQYHGNFRYTSTGSIELDPGYPSGYTNQQCYPLTPQHTYTPMAMVYAPSGVVEGTVLVGTTNYQIQSSTGYGWPAVSFM